MLSVLTPAKINLFLNIRPPRPDGFHELCTVYQAVALWDRLDVFPAPETTGLRFSCNLPALEAEAESNLVVRAYHLFWERAHLPPMGMRVHLHKDIPMQAGLGGGSSDAAAMLSVLNHLAFEALTPPDLLELAAALGSDVPFFLNGGTMLGRGRGELLESVPAGLESGVPLVIIKPRNVNIDTSLAYHRYARMGWYEQQSPEHLLNALSRNRQTRFEGLESYLLNDFEKILYREYPLLDHTRHLMRDCGIRRPMVSGSGSSMFGFVEETPEMKERVSAKFRPDHYQVFWSSTWDEGIRQLIPATAG